MSPNACHDPVSTPINSPGTPLVSKRMRRSSTLSPVTPKRNVDKTCNRGSDRPKAKIMGRFTRSMAKGNAVKSPVNDGVRVETIVIDDEEVDPVFPIDNHNVAHESISNPADDSLPTSTKDVRVDPIVDPPAKGKPIEANLSDSYQVGDMMHPMFVNCLLDKIHSMEGRVIEMLAYRDIVETVNLNLKEQLDAENKPLLRVKKHKNRLIRRVLKLQNETDKNEERVRELNAQVTLMYFKGQSSNPAKGINIQVFNAPVNL